MKRNLSFLLLALLLFTLTALAACADASPPPSGTPPEEETPDTPPFAGGDSQTPQPGPDDAPEPAPEPEPTPEPTPTPKPEPKRDVLIQAITNGVNIRSGPSTGSSVVGSMDQNDMVAYVSRSGDWYETVYKQKRAYVSANSRHTALAYFSQGSAAAEDMIDIGKTLLGIPYVLGAQRLHWGNGVMNTAFTGKSYDCSSFTQYIAYKAAHVLLETTTRGQCQQGASVSKANLQRGDLMFFTNDSRYNNTGLERIGHVAVYLGDNYILHTSSDFAVIEPISTKRWSYFITARRVL